MFFSWFTTQNTAGGCSPNRCRRRGQKSLARKCAALQPPICPATVRVRQVVQVLLAEKDWVGGSGFEVTEEIKVTVAGMAAILVLGLEEPYFFDEVRSIIIYPGPYVDPAAYRRQDAIVGEGHPRLGEAWYHGPIVLSWREVLFRAAETRATATMSFSMN